VSQAENFKNPIKTPKKLIEPKKTTRLVFYYLKNQVFSNPDFDIVPVQVSTSYFPS
jgi:hypothetical protein